MRIRLGTFVVGKRSNRLVCMYLYRPMRKCVTETSAGSWYTVKSD
jgi:hypothetical protein